MQKFFDLCLVRHIRLEYEPEKKGVSFFAYMSPYEQLKRFFDDPNVFQQYLLSGIRNEQYDYLGQKWYSDFFQSDTYKQILLTLPKDSPYPPILLGIYS